MRSSNSGCHVHSRTAPACCTIHLGIKVFIRLIFSLLQLYPASLSYSIVCLVSFRCPHQLPISRLCNDKDRPSSSRNYTPTTFAVMDEADSRPKTVAERIAALQKRQDNTQQSVQPKHKGPNAVSGRIASLQNTVEPAFLSSRNQATGYHGDEFGSTENEDAPKPKKKPPPGAVSVMLPFISGPPSLNKKQKGQMPDSTSSGDVAANDSKE